MKSFRDIRVIPVVLVAIFGLMVLKIAGLVLDGGYVFDFQPNSISRPATVPAVKQASIQPPMQAPKQASWAQDTLNFPGGAKGDAADITGSAHSAPPPKPAAPAAEPAKPDGVVVFPDQTPRMPESERAVLERLQTRRQELDQRAREIEIRESLLKAAEKRIETKVEEMKALEGKAATAAGQRNEQESARFKGI
ncbi:MAG: hypothetical protein GY873_27265, partial [Bosea sp.]|nr:hypothetical protein [Bosea sp. (in: a-proteobacteria)]